MSSTDLITIGKLELRFGQIVACDPFFCADAQPLSHFVPPGSYDVQVRRFASPEWGERIALAKLLIRPGEAEARLEPAYCEPGHAGYFIVHSGLASYMDEATRVAFSEALASYHRTNPAGNYYRDILAAEFENCIVDQVNRLGSGMWNMHRVPGTGLNIAMFASGLGDGTYRSWWGLASSGEIVSLITDFGLL